MVAMSVRNENIIHIAKIYAQQLCVSDKHITCSRIKQDSVPLCLQKDRKPVLCFKRRITRSII